MDTVKPKNGIRLGVVVLLVCIVIALAIIVVYAVMSSNPPARARTALTVKPPAVIKHKATIKPPQVVEPVAVVADAIPDTTDQPMTLEGQWGIQISSIALTHEDTVLEVYYTVIDPKKTVLLANGQTPAYLMDLAGMKIPLAAVTREGSFSAHSTARSAALMKLSAGTFPPAPNRTIAGRTYFIMIPNQDGVIKRGSLVYVVVGNVQSGNIVVE